MRIVVLHAGGLGDLILVETLLAALRERHPKARIELACRAALASVPALYERPPDAIHGFDFDPYRWAEPHEAVAPLQAYLAKLPRKRVDLFVGAELRATWLTDVLAAVLTPRAAVTTGARPLNVSTIRIVLRKLGLRPNVAIRRIASDGEHELDRYSRLAGTNARRLPTLRDLRAGAPAERVLVCFPAGTPELKLWDPAAFTAAAHAIASHRGWRLVLVGSPAERALLEAFAARAKGRPAFDVLTGDGNDVEPIATAIARASGYLGIDTGLAHLAAALRVPGVTVYGGGTWPSYAPWAARSAGVVAPIPCFGCHWDCTFERAFCIEPIRVHDVVRAFDGAAGDGSELPSVVEVDAYDATERAILSHASSVHRAAQADRAARLTAIIRLRDMLERLAARLRAQAPQQDETPDVMRARVAATAQRLLAHAQRRS